MGLIITVEAEDLLLNETYVLEQVLQGKISGMMVVNCSGLMVTRQWIRFGLPSFSVNS